jgi:hypothetical protein
MLKHHPEDPLFAQAFRNSDGVLVADPTEHTLAAAARACERHVPARKIFVQHHIASPEAVGPDSHTRDAQMSG